MSSSTTSSALSLLNAAVVAAANSRPMHPFVSGWRSTWFALRAQARITLLVFFKNIKPSQQIISFLINPIPTAKHKSFHPSRPITINSYQTTTHTHQTRIAMRLRLLQLLPLCTANLMPTSTITIKTTVRRVIIWQRIRAKAKIVITRMVREPQQCHQRSPPQVPQVTMQPQSPQQPCSRHWTRPLVHHCTTILTTQLIITPSRHHHPCPVLHPVPWQTQAIRSKLNRSQTAPFF